MLRLMFCVFLLPSFLTACGSGYKTEKVKLYRFAVASRDANMQREFRSLIDEYNRMAGMKVLHYSDDPSEANSVIVITEGLQKRDGKVGWGQWMSESKSDSPLGKMPGQKSKRLIRYSMRVEFDADYMRRNDTYAKQKLFFHEVGHGLEMDHNPEDIQDVMFPDVAGDKNFPDYFERVRSYLADRLE